MELGRKPGRGLKIGTALAILKLMSKEVKFGFYWHIPKLMKLYKYR